MKSGGSEAYLPGSGNTEGSSNDGSGQGGFPLLRFFPSACLLLPFMLTVFSRCPASPASFFVLRSWLFFFSFLYFFSKKQRNENLLVALFSSLYYVCSEGEGGGATGDEVGAPVLAGQCASLFLSLQSSLSRLPWFCFCLPRFCDSLFSAVRGSVFCLSLSAPRFCFFLPCSLIFSGFMPSI